MNVCINYKCYIIIESTIERIVVNKISGSKVDICHYWYLLDKGFKFQPYVSNRCHDLLVMPINLNTITVLNINGTDYCCNGISKSNTANLLQNTHLTKKREIL